MRDQLVGRSPPDKVLDLVVEGHRAWPALELAEAIEAVRAAVQSCSVCFQLDASDPCSVCSDDTREQDMLLVVEDPREVARFEEVGYRGVYHVLQGRLSQLEGIKLEDLTISALLRRVEEGSFREVCLATNPDLEGEGTAQLRDNDIYSNRGIAGLVVRVACDVVVANNELHDNTAAGVLLIDGANPLLAKNLLRHNGTNGVRCEAGGKGRLERNVIEENGASGIFAEAGCGPTIGENFVQHNEDAAEGDEAARMSGCGLPPAHVGPRAPARRRSMHRSRVSVDGYNSVGRYRARGR